MKGKNFFWFALGVAILLVAAYGVFSGRLNEFILNPKSGEFKFTMLPPSSKSTIPAVSKGENGGTLSVKVPGIGPVEIKDDDVFTLRPEKGSAIDRNLAIIKTAVIEGKTDIRYQQEDSGGTFSVWVRYVEPNQRGELCTYYSTFYDRFSGSHEWGLFRACKTVDGWVSGADPSLVSMIPPR